MLSAQSIILPQVKMFDDGAILTLTIRSRGSGLGKPTRLSAEARNFQARKIKQQINQGFSAA
jgi:hypothetical protein